MDSFTVDGAVDAQKWESNEGKRVLFILKEANGSNSVINGKIDDNSFWFKDCICDNNNRMSKPMFKRIATLYKFVLGENVKDCQRHEWDQDNKKELRDILKNVAYMNINKKGGDKKTNMTKLNQYAKEYREEIKQEIEILNPDYIVCGGTYWQIVDSVLGEFKRLKENDRWSEENNFCIRYELPDKKCQIYNCWHPLYHCTYDKYKARIEKCRNIMIENKE